MSVERGSLATRSCVPHMLCSYSLTQQLCISCEVFAVRLIANHVTCQTNKGRQNDFVGGGGFFASSNGAREVARSERASDESFARL
jgi:hypothetical protein